MAEGCRRLHNEELHNLETSTNITRVTKSRSIGLAVQVANTGELRNSYEVLVRKPEGKRPLEDLEVDGK